MNTETVILQNDLPLLPAKELHAGNLRCLYENGNLRFIRWGQTEVLRMIYAAVRNEFWETAPYVISDENIKEGAGSFDIRYTAQFLLGKIDYVAQFQITGTATGVITFAMVGRAQTDFLRNRIGLCVHHPIPTCVGREVVIGHDDGGTTRAAFPDLISPHQPFQNIREMAWATAEGLEVRLLFSGDVFETEDQRNWTDASFKTYGTPLSLPFPVQVLAGERIRQSVQLQVSASATSKQVETKQQQEYKVPFPAIGYCVGASGPPPDLHLLLQQVPCDHLFVPLNLQEEAWHETLQRATVLAQEVKTRLLLAVSFTVNYLQELQSLLTNLEPVAGRVLDVLVLEHNRPTPSPELLDVVRKAFHTQLPGIHTGYGTDGFFAELNRNLPPGIPADFVSFSLNPQVHASDTRSVWENLGSQADTLRTLGHHLPGMPVHVGPITLRTRSIQEPGGIRLLPPDERQYSRFAAMWTLAAIANLAGAQRLSFYECFGAGGLVTMQDGKWVLSEVFSVLQTIKQFAPVWVVDRTGIASFEAQALCLENASGERLLFSLQVPGML